VAADAGADVFVAAVTDSTTDRVAALEAKVHELETLVNLTLRLMAIEKPLSALLNRYGASESEDRAIHALIDDLIQRIEAGGIYAPSFAGFVSDLVRRFPAVRDDREFVSLLLETLKIERPAYRRLHAYAASQGWPHWR
jgi:hypothetical protein